MDRDVAKKMAAAVSKDVQGKLGDQPDPRMTVWGPEGDQLEMPGTGTPGSAEEKGVKAKAPVGTPAPEPSQPEPREEKVVEADLVPKRALEDLGKHKKIAETQNKELLAENQRLQEQLHKYEAASVVDQAVQSDRPKTYGDWELDRQNAWMAQQVAQQGQAGQSDRMTALEQSHREMATQLERRTIQDAIGVTGGQLDAAQQVWQDTGGTLSAEQLLYVTKDRFPDLFPQPEALDLPPSHQVNPPAPPGQRRAKPDEDSELRDKLYAADTPKMDRLGAMKDLVKKQLFGK